MVMSYLPVIAVFFPLLAAIIVPLVEKVYPKKGNLFTALACFVSFIAVCLMYPEIRAGKVVTSGIWDTGLGIDFSLWVDPLGFIAGLIGIALWMFSSIYAIEYMSKEHAQIRYNVFSLFSLAGLLGTFFTRNLLSLYIFFEILTIASYVMVIHEESPEAMEAGILYLFMGIGGGLILLFSIIATYVIAGTGDLSLVGIGLKEHPLLPWIFWGFIIGFGVKAGIFPLHIWLPSAHPIAPSPASALLSGIMIKAGAYGIFRTVYCVIGFDCLRGHNLMVGGLLISALVAIFLGSAVAIAQKEIKKLLAYSSISQMGYIILGAALLTPLGLTGGAVHIFNHAIIKGGLFLCAGAFIHQTGLRMLEDLRGIGKRMPITTLCFTLGALSMIGLPPFNGFVSKWFLALGSLQVAKVGVYGANVGIIALGMLLLSSLMNLIYYGPIIYQAWFGKRVVHNEHHQELAKNDDPNLIMIIPLILLALATLFFGIFPQLPLNLAHQVSRIYLP